MTILTSLFELRVPYFVSLFKEIYLIIDNEHIVEYWKLLKLLPDEVLHKSYLTIHQAVQFLALMGRSFIMPRPDDSQTTFGYDPEKNVFVGDWINLDIPVRAELCPVKLEIYLVENTGKILSKVNMRNNTRKEVYGRLKLEIAKLGLPAHKLHCEMHYDIPHHETIAGGKYVINTRNNYHQEIVNYYANAFHLLNGIRTDANLNVPLRCWPHHFDMCMDILPNKNDDQLSTIKLGFSPLDIYAPEPYFYIRTTPAILRSDNCNGLIGKIIKRDWVGAVLSVKNLIKYKTPQQQSEAVCGFYNHNIDYIMSLLPC